MGATPSTHPATKHTQRRKSVQRAHFHVIIYERIIVLPIIACLCLRRRIKRTLKLNGFLLRQTARTRTESAQAFRQKRKLHENVGPNLSQVLSHGLTFQPYFYSVIHLEMARQKHTHTRARAKPTHTHKRCQ